MKPAAAVCSLLLLASLAGCSTLKGWFTVQGQKLVLAQTLADRGHPLGASALAAEALALDPRYQEAQALLARTFAPGQEEFQTETARWRASEAPQRWDELVTLYRWQDSLASLGPGLMPFTDPATGLVLDLRAAPVKAELAEASRGASVHHWDRARPLLAASPGPRQARLALAEGRTAASFDAQTPGLAPWLAETEAAAAQKLLVVPFYWESWGKLGAVPGALGSAVSRKLLEEPGLPELTTVFPSDRLVTLPGGGMARAGLVSQPDALALAASAGQNLVLMGQVTRALYREPVPAVRTETREKQAVVVDPAHPAGVTETYKATVVTTELVTSAELSATFTVIEAATGRDLVTAVRDASASDRAVVTTFTGDKRALSSDDLAALGSRDFLVGPEVLRARALDSLAAQVAAAVREALK